MNLFYTYFTIFSDHGLKLCKSGFDFFFINEPHYTTVFFNTLSRVTMKMIFSFFLNLSLKITWTFSSFCWNKGLKGTVVNWTCNSFLNRGPVTFRLIQSPPVVLVLFKLVLLFSRIIWSFNAFWEKGFITNKVMRYRWIFLIWYFSLKTKMSMLSRKICQILLSN